MNIELWGSYPPPIGGVSIHVMRLIHALNEYRFVLLRNFKGNKKVSFKYVHNVRYPLWEFVSLLMKRKRIIHLHSNNVYTFLALYMTGFRHHIGVTLHNKRLIDETSFIRRSIIKRFLKKASFVILNDPHYKQLLLEKEWIKEETSYVLPAFIPPTNQERCGVNETIRTFRTRHPFLISANASQLILEDRVDTYGFDLLIDLIVALKKRCIAAGLIFCLPQIGDTEYYDSCLKKIRREGIEQQILIVSEPLTNGFEIWELSDLFIRPTSTDIEGVSVKEALLCGTPVIASDVCLRPSSSILFRNRDFNDLLEKTMDVYHHPMQYKPLSVDIGNPVTDILNIYKNLCNSSTTTTPSST